MFSILNEGLFGPSLKRIYTLPIDNRVLGDELANFKSLFSPLLKDKKFKALAIISDKYDLIGFAISYPLKNRLSARIYIESKIVEKFVNNFLEDVVLDLYELYPANNKLVEIGIALRPFDATTSIDISINTLKKQKPSAVLDI